MVINSIDKATIQSLFEGVQKKKTLLQVYNSLKSSYSKQVWCFQDIGDLSLFPNCIINEAMFFHANNMPEKLLDDLEYPLQGFNLNYILNSYRTFLRSVEDFVFQKRELVEYRDLFLKDRNSYSAKKRYPDELFYKLKSGEYDLPIKVKLAIEKFEGAFISSEDDFQYFLKDYKKIVEESPLEKVRRFFIDLPKALEKLDIHEKPECWIESICEMTNDLVYETYWEYLDDALSEGEVLKNKEGELIGEYKTWDLYGMIMGFDCDKFRERATKVGLGTLYQQAGFIFIEEIESSREVSQEEWFKTPDNERHEICCSATEEQSTKPFFVVSSPYLEYVNIFDYFSEATYISGMNTCILSRSSSQPYSYFSEEDYINSLLSLSKLFAELKRIDSFFGKEKEDVYAAK